jgi:hypothetical protein
MTLSIAMADPRAFREAVARRRALTAAPVAAVPTLSLAVPRRLIGCCA